MPPRRALPRSIGRNVGAASTPFSEFHKRPGERIGLNWRYGRPPNGKVKRITFDTNYWKTHVHARLAVGKRPMKHVVGFGMGGLAVVC